MAEPFRSPRYILPFDTRKLPNLFCDVLVLGTGAAGLRAAAEASTYGEVVVCAKDDPKESNTSNAQGGVASVLDKADSFDQHVEDTLAAGCGLGDEEVVRTVIREGPDELRLLETWGLRFDRENGRISLTREGGHSQRRVAHAGGDATGSRISDAMLAHVEGLGRVTLIDRCFAVDLITDPSDGGVVGALVLRRGREPAVFRARSVIVASGGAGKLFSETTNPDVATGDGMAMAWRAGAELRDLEFVQFHPTSLYLPGAPRFLITEAVRGEGGVLLDAKGHRFMPEYHPKAELAPRDVVSRSILSQMKKTDTSCVFLDLTGIRHTDPVRRFPKIATELARYNIDPGSDRVPVRPSAHYLVGGVRCDLSGRTCIPGLFVCGEAASTGLHGANRLGSNSLLEALVTGRRAGETAGTRATGLNGPGSPLHLVVKQAEEDAAELNLADAENSVRALMWRKVGIERTARDLEEASEKTGSWSQYVFPSLLPRPRFFELANLLTLARLTARCAGLREETRGVHFRRDFPDRDDDRWQVHITSGSRPDSSGQWVEEQFGRA